MSASVKATVVQGKVQIDIAASLATSDYVVYEVCDTTWLYAKATVSGTMLLPILPK